MFGLLSARGKIIVKQVYSAEGNDEINVLSTSQYYAIDIPFQLKNKNNINVLSINAQSINAKFDSLLAYIKMHVIKALHFIYIQESWLRDDSDLSLFKKNGFNCFSRGHSCASHGGLQTYVDESVNACALDVDINSQIWEGMFLLIKDNHTEKRNNPGKYLQTSA